MKIWYGYGSEHSANLVMLARFKSVAAAERAKRAIERLRQQCSDHVEVGDFHNDVRDSYPDDILKLLTEMNIGSVHPAELEQFLYDYTMSLEGSTVKIETEEVEVSSFLKLFFSWNAKIEVYSAHPESVDEAGLDK